MMPEERTIPRVTPRKSVPLDAMGCPGYIALANGSVLSVCRSTTPKILATYAHEKSGRLMVQTGQTFGRLTVLRRAGSNRYGGALWQCLCSCGTTPPPIRAGLLRQVGGTASCGCLRREASAESAEVKRVAKQLNARIWPRICPTCSRTFASTAPRGSGPARPHGPGVGPTAGARAANSAPAQRKAHPLNRC